MSDSTHPPFCYVCKKDFTKTIQNLHYCICDIGVCDDCVNSIKKSDNVWICPHCKVENDIEKTRLIRD